MMQRNTRRTVGVLTSATALMGLCLVSAPASVAAVAVSGDTLTNFGFDATAYGSKADGASGTESDPTAVSHLPCTRFVPRDVENHVAESDRGGVQTSNVDTHNFTRQRNGVTSATSKASVQGGSLAGGVVQFTDLRARNVSLHEKGRGTAFNSLPASAPSRSPERRCQSLTTERPRRSQCRGKAR